MKKFPDIPGYRITDVIGEGGMATVYKGIQEKLNREVAIKILEPSLLKNRTIAVRFLIEAETAANLSHTNIISIYDIGHKDDNQYIVMELLKETLKEHIYGYPDFRLKPEQALKILAPIADALDHAHSRGIIHRDIKTDNIMFRADGVPVLTDFGIARALDSNSQMTRTGVSLGTPYYMSPEQCQAGKMDGRSDFYSLGVVFYEVIMGEKPYEADNPTAVALKHIQSPVPKLPPELKQFQIIIDKLMAKDMEQRVANGKEFRQLMEDILAGKDPGQALVEVVEDINLDGVFMDTKTQAIPTIKTTIINTPQVPASPPQVQPEKITFNSTGVMNAVRRDNLNKTASPFVDSKPASSKTPIHNLAFFSKFPKKLMVESIILAVLLVIIFFIFYNLGSGGEKKTPQIIHQQPVAQTSPQKIPAPTPAKGRYEEQLDLAAHYLENNQLDKAKTIIDDLKIEKTTPQLLEIEKRVSDEIAFNRYISEAWEYLEKKDYKRVKENVQLAGEIKESPELTQLHFRLAQVLGRPAKSGNKNSSRKVSSASGDETAFKSAKKMDTIESYRHYIDNYPSGKHFQEAMSKLSFLQEEERLKKEAAQKKAIPSTRLRFSYRTLAFDQAVAMLQKYNFFDTGFNKKGSFKNYLKKEEYPGSLIILDQGTGLMWYGGPNSKDMSYKKALRWIKNLNRKKYGGFSDWRLPTLEEAASLLKQKSSAHNLYISSLFPDCPPNTWTGDTMRSQTYWVVRFNSGNIFADSERTEQFILPVRSSQ